MAFRLGGRAGGAKSFGDTPADLVVVGLGNPGAEYEGSRHNVGFAVVEALAARHHGALKAGSGRGAAGRLRSANVTIAGKRVVLACPLTFMNLSGEAVAPLVKRSHLADLDRLVVVHDELDLEPGRLKLKVGGGLAGHNGLKSLKAHLHSDAFVRLRVGIGRPPGRQPAADYVLRRPGRAEQDELDIAIQEAVDAIEALVTEPVESVMTRVNARAS